MLLALPLLAMGCGSSSSGKPSTGSSASSAKAPAPVSRETVERQFRRCLARAGVTLHHIGGNVPGRVPVDLPVVGADYLGAWESKGNEAVYDFWIADSSARAKQIAEGINAIYSEEKHERLEAASAGGRVVLAASEGTEHEASEQDSRTNTAIGHCEKALPK